MKQLIESGSLELYVMEALPAEEMQQIHLLRSSHPELNDEILRIETTLEKIGRNTAVPPDAEMKKRISDKLNFAIELDLEMENIKSIIIEMPSLIRYAMAASVLLLIGVSGLAVYYATNLHEARNTIALLQSQKTLLAQQTSLMMEEHISMQQQLAVVNNPSYKSVKLMGQKMMPDAVAMVYWNNASDTTYVSTAMLPGIPDSSQYQLWAIVDGKPVDMGVLSKDKPFHAMKGMSDAQAFAITLEPMGGLPTPTLDKMVVMGSAI